MGAEAARWIALRYSGVDDGLRGMYSRAASCAEAVGAEAGLTLPPLLHKVALCLRKQELEQRLKPPARAADVPLQLSQAICSRYAGL